MGGGREEGIVATCLARSRDGGGARWAAALMAACCPSAATDLAAREEPVRLDLIADTVTYDRLRKGLGTLQKAEGGSILVQTAAAFAWGL